MHIAVLGLGLMGLAIAERLRASEDILSGWNRSAARIPAAVDLGIEASTDLAVLENAEVLILTLSDAEAIRKTIDSLSQIGGRMLVQMGTIAPDESRGIESMVRSKGGRYLEAPVLGSIPEARSGRLIIMAGGSSTDFEYARPLLARLSNDPRLIGPTGQGAALKLAMNQLIAGLTASFSASLGLVRSQGIDTEVFMALLRESALYAPTFDKKLQKMLNRDYANPNFPLKHLLKDTRLFEEAGKDSSIDTRVINALCELFQSGIELGHGDDDYSSLYEAVNPAKDTATG